MNLHRLCEMWFNFVLRQRSLVLHCTATHCLPSLLAYFFPPWNVCNVLKHRKLISDHIAYSCTLWLWQPFSRDIEIDVIILYYTILLTNMTGTEIPASLYEIFGLLLLCSPFLLWLGSSAMFSPSSSSATTTGRSTVLRHMFCMEISLDFYLIPTVEWITDVMKPHLFCVGLWLKLGTRVLWIHCSEFHLNLPSYGG